MIEQLLPASVAFAEEFGELYGPLYVEEAAAVANAREPRRQEFTTGRVCARRALAQLGVPAAALPVGFGGAPRWPDGIVGSIVHCAGYRAAVAVPVATISGIGIDAEPNAPLPECVLRSVASSGELHQLTRLSDRSIHWDRLIFCAKEAVYKAWSPLTHRWLGWNDVAVQLDPRTGTFRARISVDLSLQDQHLRRMSGRWLAQDGLLLTTVVVPG